MSIMDTIRGVVSNMTMPQAQNAFSLTLVLAGGSAQVLDFKSLANLQRVDNIQGLWVDNSAGTAAAVFVVAATQQKFTVPAGYQGVAPLYVTPDMTIVVTGTGTVPIVFLNFPTPVGVWPANTAASGAFTFTGGNLNTRDVSIAAAAEAGGIDMINKYYTTADGVVHGRSGGPLSGSVTAAGNTVILAGAPSVFMSSIDISVDGNAALAAAGPLTVTLTFGTSALQVLKRTIVLPNAAPATPTPRYELFNQSGLDFIGAIAADNITMNLSAALTAGAVQYTIGGGTTAVL